MPEADEIPQDESSLEETVPITDEIILTETNFEEKPDSEFDPEKRPDSELDSEELAQTEDDDDEEIIPNTAKLKTIAAATPEGPPQWAKDLRRGEIIAFGALPFTFFFTKTFMDLYRMATHGWDSRYAPIVKSAGAVPMTDTEIKMMFGIAISSSVSVAVVDHFIVKHKRNKAKAMSE
jgi:hypothetical protein